MVSFKNERAQLNGFFRVKDFLVVMVDKYKRVFDIFGKRYILVPLEIWRDPYRTLVSTIMSARTRDETTLEAGKRLFKVAPNFKKLARLSEEEITKLIKPVGFYGAKAKNLKKTAQIILDEYGGKVPNTVNELKRLPGVGIKTANLTLNRAFGMPAISVDTHVHRITNLLGWVTTKTPEQTEKALSKVLPKKYWKDINRYFVSIGRQFYSKKKLMEFLKGEKLLPR